MQSTRTAPSHEENLDEILKMHQALIKKVKPGESLTYTLEEEIFQYDLHPSPSPNNKLNAVAYNIMEHDLKGRAYTDLTCRFSYRSK